MTNTEIKIRLEKILVRNEQRKENKLIPSDVLDIKDIIKQLSICDVVSSSKSLFQKGDKVIVCNRLKAEVLEVITPRLLKIQYEKGNAISNEFTQFIKHQKDL